MHVIAGLIKSKYDCGLYLILYAWGCRTHNYSQSVTGLYLILYAWGCRIHKVKVWLDYIWFCTHGVAWLIIYSQSMTGLYLICTHGVAWLIIIVRVWLLGLYLILCAWVCRTHNYSQSMTVWAMSDSVHMGLQDKLALLPPLTQKKLRRKDWLVWLKILGWVCNNSNWKYWGECVTLTENIGVSV